MKTERIKQIRCISASNAVDFEDRMNEALSGLSDPEIQFDMTRPFTATIVYHVRRDVPECVLELFEMIEGKHRCCSDCPYMAPAEDARKKWTTCSATGEPTRVDSRACEKYYLIRYKALTEVTERYMAIPYVAE